MKNYHVYGIGNALVDMEFEVTPDFLKANKVEKGLMTLVEEDRQKELLVSLDNKQHKRNCGGSAANTIIAATQLGGKTFYSCKVSNDETGNFYKSDLLSKGVRTNLEEHTYDGTTGKCMVFVTPDADRTMNTFLGTTATFSNEQVNYGALAQSEWLYIEGYLVTGPTGLDAAIKTCSFARENKIKTALTFSDPGIVGFFRDNFLKIFNDQKIDLVFCNESEAMSFTQTSNVEDAFVALKKSANTFAITTGSKGALVFDGENKIYIMAQKVDAVDTNGAGDIFAGSFLYAITHGLNYGEAGLLACNCASKLVTKFGARLETSQILEIKKNIVGE